jgi:hypothetical protein
MPQGAKLIPLGPWPLGVDNVHPADHRVFQVPGQNQPPPRLVAASDVDLSDEGWPRTRRPAKAVEVVVDGRGLWSFGESRYVQDGAVLRLVGSATPLVSGLVRRVEWAVYGRRLFVSDGATHREIDGSTVRAWGLPVPVVSVSAVAGSTFQPGTYVVQASFHDGRNEGGCSSPQAIVLTSASDLQVSIAGHDALATSIVLYTGRDKQRPSYAGTTAIVGSGVQVLTATVPTTQGRPPRTERMTGPWDGITSLATFRAFLLIGRDNLVCRSEGQEPHLFDPSRIVPFKAPVTDTAPLVAGFWQGTEHGLYWVAGDDPQTWIPQRKTFDPVLRGCAVLPGSHFPFLQVSDPVALFIGPTGLLVGLPSGDVVQVTQDRYHVDLDAYARASFTLATRAGIRQLLVGLS